MLLPDILDWKEGFLNYKTIIFKIKGLDELEQKKWQFNIVEKFAFFHKG